MDIISLIYTSANRLVTKMTSSERLQIFASGVKIVISFTSPSRILAYAVSANHLTVELIELFADTFNLVATGEDTINLS